jgi:hypothetical protein
VPTADSEPTGIAKGPDGALWFTEFAADNIGRMVTTGVITEYPVPTMASGPNGITAGPNHDLWFTEFYGNDVASSPACGLGLSASFAEDTLTINFNLGTSTAANWYVSLSSTGGGTQLWSKWIPAVVPTASFTSIIGPGFPDLGKVEITSGLWKVPEGGLCYETVRVFAGH